LSAELLKVNAETPNPQFIRYAASWLNRGAVVAIPTDTLYALAADPVNLAAVEQIFRVKGRPDSRALPIVVDASNRLPLKVTANTGRVALRWPNHEVVRRLIDEIGVPLTGTSANLSGSPTCESGEEVFRQLGDRIPVILDAGETQDMLPSTIVELRGDHWCIGRQGAVPAEVIHNALDTQDGAEPVPA
jgi:L-threonylcarbamoyladenylate synthase